MFVVVSPCGCWRSGSPASVSLLARPDDAGVLVQAQFADLLFGDGRYRDAIDFYERAYAGAVGDLRTAMGPRARQDRCCGVRSSSVRAGGSRGVGRRSRPEDAEALALLGDARWSAGQFDGAEEAYGECAGAEPRAGEGAERHGQGLDSRGRLARPSTTRDGRVAAGPREPEFHHTLGFVLERQRRYPEAALAYTNYSNLLPNKDSSEIAAWARQQIKFLRSFGDRQPLAVKSGTEGLVHTIPFRLRNNKIIVSGKVNGRAEMDFVLDTGSEMTRGLEARRRSARASRPLVYTLSAGVGGVGLRGLMVGTMERLQVGTLVVDQVPTLIKNPPLEGLPTQEVESFSPIAFGYSVRIDYTRRVITMARDLPAADADFVLPLRVHRLAMITGHVNGATTVPFVLDTGGEVVSISRSTADAINVVPRRRIGLLVYGTSGWDKEAFLLTGINLAFERVALENHAVPVLNLAAPSVLLGFDLGGIVGHRFLSRYDVTIDLRRSVVRLSTN